MTTTAVDIKVPNIDAATTHKLAESLHFKKL